MKRRMRQSGRTNLVVMAVVVFVVGALLLFYSQRAVPPEPADRSSPAKSSPAERVDADPDRGSGDEMQPLRPSPVVPASDSVPRESPAVEIAELPPPSLDTAEASAGLRSRLAEQLDSPLLGLVAEEQLVERLVTTINSLDGAPIPLRYRPLVHVPGLPAIDESDDRMVLPASPDPRYDRFRQLFDRIDAETLASEFERLEPALDQAWQQLGEDGAGSFRQRVIEVSRHLADFELPAQPPELERPDVLYQFADRKLESLSWGQKILIRIGPDHAREVQTKLDAVADRLERASSSTDSEPETWN